MIPLLHSGSNRLFSNNSLRNNKNDEFVKSLLDGGPRSVVAGNAV